MSRFFQILFISLILSTHAAAQALGLLSGLVRDASSQQPLVGAVIKVDRLPLAGVAGDRGLYRISSVPVGTYTVTCTLIGYKSSRKFDISVNSGNAIDLNFDLEEAQTVLQEVQVRQSSVKPIGSVNSLQTLTSNEIAKYPGGNFDIAKVVQSLPGVSGSVGFRNDIIIRGGAPNENVYYLDGVEVPSINHFATQGSGGGPVGLLNVSFVDQVNLYSSSFPAKYDNALSGVLQFRQRTGNPTRSQGNFRLSATEFAATLEGPFSKSSEKTTYIISARRSYLQLLFKLIKLPFLPSYWDFQYKITHKPNIHNEFYLTGIGAIDDFTLNSIQSPSLEQQAALDQIPVSSQRTATVGIGWKHLFDKGYFQTVLSGNVLKNNADKFDDNDFGNEAKRRTRYRSIENEDKLRFDVNWFPKPWSFSGGFSAIYSNYSNNTYQRIPAFLINYQSRIDFLRFGLFGQLSRDFFDSRLSVSAGLRSDVNTFTNSGRDPLKTFSPRLSAVYHLATDWDVSACIARYYKINPYTILGYQDQGVYLNKDVPYIRSDHYVAGVEFRPSGSSKLSVEAFYKAYSNYPVSIRDSVSLANEGGDFNVLGNEAVTGTGKGKAYGIELTYQKRLSKNFYGILAYTFYYSRFSGLKGLLKPSAWDNRNLVSFTGGYRFAKNWELGVRARYLGSSPYTPYNNEASLDAYPFTGGAKPDYTRLNTLRLSSFNAADVRVDKKWNFRRVTLDLYADIQNVYSSKNPTAPTFTLKRNADGTIATTSGPYSPGSFVDPSQPNNRRDALPVLLDQSSGSLLPTIGFIVEF